MEKIKKYLGLYPFLFYMLFFYLYGLYYVVMTSFGFFGVEESRFTLENYKKVFENKEFYSSLFYTLKLNIFSAVISLLIAIFILYIIFLGNRYNKKINYIFSKILEIPIYISYLIGTYGVFILLSRGGVISSFFQKIGIIKTSHDFPILVNDDYGVGIILTFIWKSVPFIVMMVLPILLKIENKWKKLSAIYGMEDLKFYLKIVLPLILPALMMTFFIILAYFFSAFETPYILGKTYPQTLSVYIFELYSKRGLDSRGVVMVLNIILSVFTLLIGGIVYLIMKKIIKESDRGW